MAQIELLLPKMGESVAEATIIKWLKEEGDAVEADEPIVEIATDKVDSEVPAPEDGILVKRLVDEDSVVQVGEPIAILSTGGETQVVTAAPAQVAAPAPVAQEVLEAVTAPMVAATSAISKNGPSGRFYSPLVRNIAKEEGVSMADLEAIQGSGADGRVTKNDILGYIKNRGNGASAPAAMAAAPVAVPKPSNGVAKAAAPKATGPGVTMGAGDEIVEMGRMRKLIADHMVNSVQTSPHVTSFVEADVTNIVNWRNKNKDAFFKKEGQKLTFTPIFMEAVVKAIKEMPGVNVQVKDGDKVVYKKDINLGMATARPDGNLIVPVIKNADNLNLVGLAKSVNDLAKRARTNELKPEEISGGTYTVTNVGTFGNVMGTPIINQPQVAIMALGAIRKRPAVIETEHGDVIAIRHMMFLSHSYDHRVVDGMLGGTFVRKVADILESWDIYRTV